MTVKDMNMKGFKGIVTRQCRGKSVYTYNYHNGCTIYVYRHACVLKQPDGYIVAYTGSDVQCAYDDALAYTDPAQSSLDSFIKR